MSYISTIIRPQFLELLSSFLTKPPEYQVSHSLEAPLQLPLSWLKHAPIAFSIKFRLLCVYLLCTFHFAGTLSLHCFRPLSPSPCPVRPLPPFLFAMSFPAVSLFSGFFFLFFLHPHSVCVHVSFI